MNTRGGNALINCEKNYGIMAEQGKKVPPQQQHTNLPFIQVTVRIL